MDTMKTADGIRILEAVKAATKAGRFTSLKTRKPVKMKAGFGPYFKESEYSGARFGLDYDNMASTKEARAEGDAPATPQPLKWGAWIEFPWLIGHENKKGERNNYIRFYARPSAVRTRFLDASGNEVDREVVKSGAYASEFPKRGEPRDWLTLTIKASAIVEVNGKPIR